LEASDLETPLSTQIYNEDEELIGTVFDEENRVQIDIEDVPDEMKDAIVSIEDKRFYKHNGVDFRRILKAVLANIKHGWGSEGGSTISQQVIKRSVLSSEKTLERKVQEAWLAIELEREYSKDEILELYLNNVNLGNGSYGIKTASKSYFSKDIKDLNLSQMAMLAGLPNAPSLDDPPRSTSSTARSVQTSAPTMEAVSCSPDSRFIWSSSAPSTTWLFVTMYALSSVSL